MLSIQLVSKRVKGLDPVFTKRSWQAKSDLRRAAHRAALTGHADPNVHTSTYVGGETRGQLR